MTLLWGLMQMVELLKWSGAVSVALHFLSWFFVNRALLRVEEKDVQILRNAGIKKIDWWISCLVGVFRLAFGAVGAPLAAKQRLWLRLYWIFALVAAAALGIAFKLESAGS